MITCRTRLVFTCFVYIGLTVKGSSRVQIIKLFLQELLALEEKMGTVSTALSEEALIKSLKLSTFNHPREKSSGVCVKNKDDDVKCSICQVSIHQLSLSLSMKIVKKISEVGFYDDDNNIVGRVC